MRRPIIDWNECDFETRVNGYTYRIVTSKGLSYYRAVAIDDNDNGQGYLKQCYVNYSMSEVSTEDAILKLVKILEDK